jgi:DNA-binding beta-propeller fold protein YncE
LVFDINLIFMFLKKRSRFYFLIIDIFKNLTHVFFSEMFTVNSSIKKEYKQVITFVGSGCKEWKDGQGEDASFHYPYGVAIYNDQVIVADSGNHRIRMIDMNTQEVSTLAGSGRAEWKDGRGEDASFCHPQGVAIYNDQIIVADTYNHRVRMIDMDTQEVSTLAGSGNEGWKDGQGEDVSFYHPSDVTTYNDQIIVADTENHRIRMIDMNTREVSTLAGSGRMEWKDGQGEDASFNHPSGVAIYNDQIIVTDTWNNRIRMMDMDTREVSTLAGSGRAEYKDGQGEDAAFNHPYGVAVDPMSGQVIVADIWNHRIRLLDIKSGMVSTLGSGREEWKDGQGKDALFHYPYGVEVDSISGQVIVTLMFNHSIRMIDNCFVGIFEWEKDVKQLFLDTSIPNPIVDIILMYCNYNFKRTLSTC